MEETDGKLVLIGAWWICESEEAEEEEVLKELFVGVDRVDSEAS
jgi:hypothetical protein